MMRNFAVMMYPLPSYSVFYLLAREIVTLPPRYILKIKEKNKDAVRFSRRFNGSRNKGYLYTASLIGRKEGNSY